MKFFFILLLSLCSLASMGQTIINDKNVEVRNVNSFSGIKVSGGIEIFLSQSNEYALAVSASEDKYRDEIETGVKNGILSISFNGRSFNFSGDKRLRAYVSFKTLQSIEASGASDLNINGTFTTNSAKIKLSGACEMKGVVDIENLDLDLNGASTVKIKGTVTNLKIEASGASDIKNYDLIVDNCLAKLSGASDVRITINKSISATASGASSLNYKGNPERREVNTSGASNISQRD